MVEKKFVCAECVSEAYLGDKIVKEGQGQTCDYCGDKQPAITIEELADYVEGAFERHYYRTSDQPEGIEWAMAREHGFERHGEPVLCAIGEAAEVDEDIATDILEILSQRHLDMEMAQMGDECEFDSDSHYEWKRPSDYEMQFGWNEVEASLKRRSRFFNDEAVSFLTKLFAGLAEKTTEEGKPVIVDAGPDHELKGFFRGRVFSIGDDIERALKRPDIELAGPPTHLARAGRMNAQGISVFYGATKSENALAEIRPPVGSAVLIGYFELLENVRLLDLEALSDLLVAGSIFDPEYEEKLAQARFLKGFTSRMTMPVMPNEEASEYLATQMVADFLAQKADTELHGILYRSAQVGGEGKNVALFHDASKVEELEFAEGTEIRAHLHWDTDDGPEIHYSVYEEVPPAEEKEGDDDDDPFPDIPWGAEPLFVDHEADGRVPKLKIDLESLEVHHVDGVSFKTEKHGVRRTRSEKRELPF